MEYQTVVKEWGQGKLVSVNKLELFNETWREKGFSIRKKVESRRRVR